MKHITVIIFFVFSLTLAGQNGFYLGGQIGYGYNQGPVEKYRGVQIGTFVRYQIKNVFIQPGFEHYSGAPDYGTYYSKDLPRVAVYDIYNDNYPLAIYPADDFSETKVGVHQFDPSYGKYISRQYSLGVGYKIPFKIRNLSFASSPSLHLTYRIVNENFVYGVKEIKVEDSFQSNNYVPINHLIFAYLRYANIGYQIIVPIELSLSQATSISTVLNFNSNNKRYNNFGINLGVVTKI